MSVACLYNRKDFIFVKIGVNLNLRHKKLAKDILVNYSADPIVCTNYYLIENFQNERKNILKKCISAHQTV